MTIIGRVTKDASIATLKSEKKVVNFSIVINDWYKPKGAEQGVKVATYFNCSYWISTAIAERLTKGSLVELSGRLSVNAYIGAGGEAKGSLNFHVNAITIHHVGRENKTQSSSDNKIPAVEVKDDLPF